MSGTSKTRSKTTDSTASAIPPRPRAAVGGARFIANITSLKPAAREAAIVKEVLAGNIPQHLRSFKTVHALAVDADGTQHSVAYQVMPDYLSIGHDDDFVRVPMTPMSAQRIADRFGCTLPTSKMVSQIYRQSDVKLSPRPLTRNRQAPTTFAEHNAIIEQQRQGKPLGLLVVGIKKDVVITNRLAERPRRVAIFGWHRLSGQPIQPLTTVHVNTYVDYSHGVRLVKREMEFDGRPMAFDAIVQDDVLCSLISDEGVILEPRY